MLFAFGWANMSMLGWLAAAAAPIIIHLWSRQRHREVSWAATEYLLAAARRQTHRLMFEQWLLLAIRMLLVVLVVLAVAEPYMERPSRAAASPGNMHRVLVLDGSFSMGYRLNDKTRFDRAKELARQIVADSPQGDAFTLVLMSSPPQVIVNNPTLERSEIEREIDNLQLPDMPADLPATVAAVRHLIDMTSHANPRLTETEVYFLTDLQRVTWTPKLPTATGDALRQQTEALNRVATVSVIDVGGQATENRAVTNLRAAEPLLIVGRSVQFEAELKSFGRQSGKRESPILADTKIGTVHRQSVEWLVDGRRIEQKETAVTPESTTSATFTYRFDSSGDHVIEIRAGRDALEIDNRRFLVVHVRQATRALCIDGRPSGTAFHGAADYLAVALNSQDRTAARSVVQAVTAAESAVMDRDLRSYDCVLLCNVAQFTAAEARVLDAYLKSGGSLVFFLGDQVMPDRYNRELGGAGQNSAAPRILPARLADVIDAHHSELDPLGYRHPIVQAFRGRGEAALVTTPVLKYYKLTPAQDSQAATVVAMSNGDPLIVAEPVHRGRVVLLATAAEPRSSWTAMPLLPSFVPLVQEIVSWCVSGDLRYSNVLAGEPLDLPITDESVGAPPTVQTPDGRNRAVPRVFTPDHEYLRYPDTRQSGIYVAKLGPDRSRTFAVNVDTHESDLAPISPQELQREVWPRVRFDHPASQPHVGSTSAAASDRSTRDLRAVLLYLAIGLLFADTLLARKVGR